jgi:predicted ABC-type ATPase
MSHPSKLETFQQAAEAGFKSYLYFISTEDPSINKDRVAARVAKGGHAVLASKIEERYFCSLELLIKIIAFYHRCFVFDNSGTSFELAVAVVDGEDIIVHTEESIPSWVDKYLLKPLEY